MEELLKILPRELIFTLCLIAGLAIIYNYAYYDYMGFSIMGILSFKDFFVSYVEWIGRNWPSALLGSLILIYFPYSELTTEGVKKSNILFNEKLLNIVRILLVISIPVQFSVFGQNDISLLCWTFGWLYLISYPSIVKKHIHLFSNFFTYLAFLATPILILNSYGAGQHNAIIDLEMPKPNYSLVLKDKTEESIHLIKAVDRGIIYIDNMDKITYIDWNSVDKLTSEKRPRDNKNLICSNFGLLCETTFLP